MENSKALLKIYDYLSSSFTSLASKFSDIWINIDSYLDALDYQINLYFNLVLIPLYEDYFSPSIIILLFMLWLAGSKRPLAFNIDRKSLQNYYLGCRIHILFWQMRFDYFWSSFLNFISIISTQFNKITWLPVFKKTSYLGYFFSQRNKWRK